MIIDKILDRKDGEKYKAHAFYIQCLMYGDVGDGYRISAVMDYGEEEDVKQALCNYVLRNEYNPKICDYIRSVKWLSDDGED